MAATVQPNEIASCINFGTTAGLSQNFDLVRLTAEIAQNRAHYYAY